MSPINLLEDHHVHSTFSDGRSSLEDNIAAAEQGGLRHLGCVDHVRVDSTYVPEYAAAIRALRATTALTLTIGIEAKILDTSGRLDFPVDALDHVDRVYAADHQFPWTDGPRSPRQVKTWIEQGEVSPARCIEMLVEATIAAMRANRSRQLVLAHVFSILPKVGLTEADVPETLIRELVTTALDTNTIVEVSERWHCPSTRIVRAMRTGGVVLVCSTDSHAAATIGRYQYVRSTIEELAA